MNKLHMASEPLATEMVRTGVEPLNAQKIFEQIYGERVYSFAVVWDSEQSHTWRATAKYDFVTGYGDEITIFIKRSQTS